METTMNATTVALTDYIISLPDAISKGGADYEVVLTNNTDFIVRRRTQTKERDLVILVSQGLYYIKDCKTEAVEPVTENSLRSFLRDLRDRVLPLEKVHWLKHLCKEAVEYIMKVVSDETITDMCRHNVMADMQDPDWFTPYWKQNSKLFIRLHKIFPSLTDRAKFQPSIPIIFWLEDRVGTNEALYFAEHLVQSGIRSISMVNGYNTGISKDISPFINLLDASYKLNLRRIIDYLLFDLFRQGYASIGRSFLTEYTDYLRMQLDFYGKIREKYPDSFKTAHDVMALKVNLAKETEQCQNFEKQAEEIQNLAYQGKQFCVLIPTKPKELADEGINLSHCVGDYISRVASGECHILFMRRKSTPEESLVTLQLSGTCIVQAQGRNRRSITKEERSFLQRWCAEKGLDIAV